VPAPARRDAADLPPERVGPLFQAAQRLCVAVAAAMDAQGTFVAMNNVVSQSVPHLHVHVVPAAAQGRPARVLLAAHRYADARDGAVAARDRGPAVGRARLPRPRWPNAASTDCQRVLGVNALFATAYGNVGSSIYYALGLVAGLALGLTPFVFLITGFFFFCTAATYAEATAMFPEAGGSSSFARRAFNEFVSFFAAWAQMLNYIITVAISAFFVPHYLGGLFWEPLRSAPGDIIFGAGVIAFLSLVNVVGVKESAGLNVLLAVVDFLTQVLLVLVGIVLVLSPDVLVSNVDFGVAPTWTQFLLAIPLGMIAYTGIETISNMAEEAKDETRTDPEAISRVRLAVFAIYFTLPAVALSALPVTLNRETGEYQTLLGLSEEEGGFAGDPILGVVKEIDLGPLQSAGELYVGLLAATILFIATNAGIIGVSRLVYSMGIYRQVPDRLRQLHPRYGTPWIGILIFGFIAIVTLLPGQAEFLGNMYAFGAMLSFTVAHLSVIVLRLRQPDLVRPYRGPGNIALSGGRSLPLFAVVGGTGTALAFIVVTALNPEVAAAGRAVARPGPRGLPRLPPPPGAGPAEHHEGGRPAARDRPGSRVRVGARGLRGARLLPGRDGHRRAPGRPPAPRHPRARADHRALQRAAGRRPARAGAHGPVDHRAGQGPGRPAGVGHFEKVRAGQAGRLIVEEARSMQARAIVMALPPRRAGGAGASVFGRTVETVLAERPCRVIIQSDPTAVPSAA
jgi:APA family basic amino acid/polyamine antiporter